MRQGMRSGTKVVGVTAVAGTECIRPDGQGRDTAGRCPRAQWNGHATRDNGRSLLESDRAEELLYGQGSHNGTCWFCTNSAYGMTQIMALSILERTEILRPKR